MRSNPRRRPSAPIMGLLCLAATFMSEGCSKASQTAPPPARSAATAAAAAPAPAPTPKPQARTQRDYERGRAAWLQRHSIAPAQKASGQDLPLDPNLANFLKHASLFQCGQEGAPDAAALETEGRTLYDAGYDNPVFLRCWGQVLAACGKTTESADIETQALMKFQDPAFSPVNVFLASAQLAETMRAQHGPYYPEALSVQRTALRKLAAAIAEGAFTPEESPIAWRLLAANAGAAGLASPWKDACEEIKGKKVDPWLLEMLRGMAELETARAWIATGGGAAAVSRMEIERNTHDHLAAARAALSQAWKSHPGRPEAAAMMIEVAGAETNPPAGETPDLWRDRALAAQADYFVESDEWRAAVHEGRGTRDEGRVTRSEEIVASSQLPVEHGNQETTTNAQQTTNNVHPTTAPANLAAPVAIAAPAQDAQVVVAEVAQEPVQTTTTQEEPVPAVPLLALASTRTSATLNTPANTQQATNNRERANDAGQLIAALERGDAAAANDLIRAKVNINVTDREGLAPLHLATEHRLTETMRLLLGRNAGVNARTPLGETPLHLACKSGAIESVRLLLDSGANPNLPAPEGWTPLDLAVQRKYASIVGLLLERGAKVNATGSRGVPPLMVAVQAGSAEIARKLLDLGADPNATPHPPATPLHEAIRLGHAEIAINLIDLGAKVNVPDRRSRMPLHAAVERRLPTVAAKLIGTGALPDARSAEGATALELAIRQGDAEMVRVLLENRASARIPTSSGGSFLDLAREKGNPQVIALIETRMAKYGRQAGPKSSAQTTQTQSDQPPAVPLSAIRH